MDRFRLFPSGELGMHPTGEWTSYADAQRALNWERERTRETLLQAMGLQQQLATLQAQLESANVLIYKKNCALGRADTTITDLQAQLRQVEDQRHIDACCEKPHDCKWGGLGGCGYEGRKYELKQDAGKEVSRG